MADLSRIDIRKINANGRYVDLANNTIIDLTDEQIMSLRRYYNDSTIAINRRMVREQESRREPSRRQSQTQRSTSRPNYRVTRDQKYNSGRHRTKKNPRPKFGKLIIVGSLVVCVVMGGKLIKAGQAQELPFDSEVNLPSYSSSVESDYGVKLDRENSNELSDIVDSIISQGSELGGYIEEQSELSNRQMMIQNICNIYQVNYTVVYPRLMELTNNFTSQDYLNGVIQGVTCKGVQVQASSEEELLVYTIRCMKQLPESMGLTTDNLYINNGYVSGNNYNEQISHVAEVLGTDRCLLYAIVQSECGFNSDMFNNRNNPAGIKGTDGSWWNFDTKEEGFFELGMEVLKYYRKIGVTPDNIDYDTISRIRDIHAPLSDGNEHWLPNVTSNLEYAKLHEAEMFNDYEQNNGLSR